jgi:hypothetical protein
MIACGDFKIWVVMAEKTKVILRLDITDKDKENNNALTVKYGGGITWGRWFDEDRGDTIDFPNSWIGNRLSWVIQSNGRPTRQTLDFDL